MAHNFQKFISKVFANGKFPKILPSKNFSLYGINDTVVNNTKHKGSVTESYTVTQWSKQ